ncbi:Outer membrane protein TolC [Candidatus Magnetaquicoccaceae bacterium FCR-1]|uniref:Outer membrane protein TolC n=1 Tax=Candidatus Magnetaquiglobus chichijimensis TaxID=3141448 RepID=A0ABQ0C712_9PROT
MFGVLKRVIGIGSLVIGLSGPAWADADKTDPFVTSIDAALRKNPRATAAAAQLRAALERLPQSQAALLPTIDLNASKGHSRLDWRDGAASTDPDVVGLSLTQVLFNQKALVAMRQTKPYIASFERDAQAAVQGVFLEASSVIVEVLQATEVVRLAKNNREVLKQHLEATRSRFRVGEITRTDVSWAESRLASAEANLVRSENTLALARTRFVEVVGMPVPEGLHLPGFREKLEALSQVEMRLRSAERPDLVAATLRLKVSEEDVALKRAGHMPSVALSARASRTWGEETSGTVDPLNKYSVDLGVTLPLYAGGMIVSQTAEAEARKDAQAADLERMRLQVEREVESALLDLKSAQAANQALESGLKAANNALDGVEREYRVGTRTALDLLDARNEAFSAQTELAKGRFALVLAGFKLLYATGGLNLDALLPAVNAVQPVAPLKEQLKESRP